MFDLDLWPVQEPTRGGYRVFKPGQWLLMVVQKTVYAQIEASNLPVVLSVSVQTDAEYYPQKRQQAYLVVVVVGTSQPTQIPDRSRQILHRQWQILLWQTTFGMGPVLQDVVQHCARR
jgi:hypothetical protein